MSASKVPYDNISLSAKGLVGLASALLVTAMILVPSASAQTSTQQDPPVAQAETVRASLLTPVQARRATGFRSTLEADQMAGPQGQSCFSGSTTWTCDGWFITERTGSAYPAGVAITVAASGPQAEAVLFALAGETAARTGNRVLASNPRLLISCETGLAVGRDLTPAVSVTVQRVQGSMIVMGTCQVEQRRLGLVSLRTCAERLQRVQGRRAASPA